MIKYSPKMIKRLETYVDSTKTPNISGLAKHLGVSRQCIYDWKQHKEFLLVLNNMLHGVIDSEWVSQVGGGEEKVPQVDIENMEPKFREMLQRSGESVFEEFKDELDDEGYKSIDG